MTDRARTVLIFSLYIVGSLCFLAGSALSLLAALRRTQ